MHRMFLNGKVIGLVAVLLVILMVVGNAADEQIDASGKWWYVLEDGGATITDADVRALNGYLVIPNELDGYPVTKIEEEAFSVFSDGLGMCTYYSEFLTSVTIPDSVTSIGARAFKECYNLASVTLGNNVTSIGDLAFFGSEPFDFVSIPASVTRIGDGAFSGFNCLVNIYVSPDNPVYADIDGVLFDKGIETLLMYPPAREGAYVIPEGVKTIGNEAFMFTSLLTDVTIPDSVTCIGNNAFDVSGLRRIVISNSVTSIGDGAFTSCHNLTNIIIPDSVTSIGNEAFYWCKGLTNVIIPDSVTSIGNEAFYWCEGLISVTIPDSVTNIGYDAFLGCDNITLHVKEGSVAEQYAKDNGILYVFIAE